MNKQGEILLIPIPFTDLKASKKRPVLVISNNEYNQATEDIIVMAITSNVKDNKYRINIKKEDMQKGDLKIQSDIRTDKIYTLSQSIILKNFGMVKAEIIEKVQHQISKLV